MFHRRGRQMDKYDPGMRRWWGERCGTQTQDGREWVLINNGVTLYPFHTVLCVSYPQLSDSWMRQFEAYTSLRPGELAEDFSPKRPPFEMAVVPLVRHQGEMDSCGKDASGNEWAQEMSPAQKFRPFVWTTVWSERAVGTVCRKYVLCSIVKQHFNSSLIINSAASSYSAPRERPLTFSFVSWRWLLGSLKEILQQWFIHRGPHLFPSVLISVIVFTFDAFRLSSALQKSFPYPIFAFPMSNFP